MLAEMILNKTINQDVFIQTQYFKYLLVFEKGLCEGYEGFLQVDHFLLKDEMREKKIRRKDARKEGRKIFLSLISEHTGVSSSGL